MKHVMYVKFILCLILSCFQFYGRLSVTPWCIFLWKIIDLPHSISKKWLLMQMQMQRVLQSFQSTFWKQTKKWWPMSQAVLDDITSSRGSTGGSNAVSLPFTPYLFIFILKIFLFKVTKSLQLRIGESHCFYTLAIVIYMPWLNIWRFNYADCRKKDCR